MSKMNFTPAQQNAIDAFGGSIIVSAAAGSGKTRVLVQRVIKHITDMEHPVSADRLLIVTFTKAAAAEMKSRISLAIDEMLSADPNNEFLRRQQLLLPRADICTIHSFCSRMIKENFFQLDISRDFRIGTDSELSVLKHRTLSDIIEERYASGDERFTLLSEILSGAKSDIELEHSLLTLYNGAAAHPFPSEWLAESAANYDPEIPLAQTRFALIAADILRSAAALADHLLERADEIISSNKAFQTGTKTSADTKYEYLSGFVSRLKRAAEGMIWDEISETVMSFSKQTYRKPTSKKLPVENYEHRMVKNCFDSIDELFLKKLVPIFGITEETYQKDNAVLYPAVCCMAEILSEFDRRYLEAKTERGMLDFSDLEHLMLRLLYRTTDQGHELTPFAKELSECYDEVMVDEYQDTNEIQEKIFRAISKNGSNLFVVGDVKQSIYRFREAEPEIFMKRRDHSLLYDKEHPAFPAKIILDKNFRSREGIIDSVNFVFQCLMSKRVGDIEYNNEERLTVGAVYPKKNDPETEIHIIERAATESSEDTVLSSDEEESNEDISVYEREAVYIARLIQSKVKNRETVTDADTQELRPVQYSDFAILMRNLSSHAHIYCDVLNRCGVPAYTDKPYSLFECYEVNMALSFLKVIDNPLRDIPMLSLLMSPVASFTPDDLSILKTETQGKYFYARILEYSQKENADDTLRSKCLLLAEMITYYRSMSVTLSADRVLDFFFEKTGYIPIISAMSNGSIRVRNIRKLMNFVRDYEESTGGGLTGFVRHIMYLEENGTEIDAADTAPENSVKIMTIHHSKGLEFPICILAALGSKGDSRQPIVPCHSELGFGFNAVDRKNMLKLGTLQKNIINFRIRSESRSEEMRVLYVALTRAKEKLIPIISVNSRSSDGYLKLLEKTAALLNVENGRISPYCVENASDFAQWLLMCAFVHPKVKLLREDSGMDDIITIPTKAEWQVFHRFVSASNEIKDEQEAAAEKPPADTQLLHLLEERFAETYQYADRTIVPTKVSASALAHSDSQLYHIAESRPAFMQQNNMTGVERGTAMHTFLQYVDFSRMETDLQAEKQRLVDGQFLTSEQREAVIDKDVIHFAASDTFRHIRNADKVLREYRFTVNIPACSADESLICQEFIILQGAIDCLVFEKDGMIVIDYKTDKVSNVSELSKRYAKQLILYKQAAEQLFEMPVKKCLIYSLYCGTEIEVGK